MARRTQDFQTIRSEGGLLPPDVLRRVIDPRGSLKGTRPEDYGLPQGERLNEVITQSWNRLRRHWSEFRSAAVRLPEGEAGTGLTNDKWSLPLLRELGFGLLPTSASPEIAGRMYAISRFFGPVPIHLVGCGLSLDRRATGVRGAAGGNPHGLVQEVLNRSTDHLWGIVGNGLRLRILRDNQALSRQSFLEFDLEAMFGAEAYSDFVLLWLVGHATRFAPRDGNRIESCWLEEWTKEAEEQGTRALTDLRGGVERALQVLGEGFTSHPKNLALREALRSGALKPADLHGQLLRLVYRLIFLFVAEDRTLEGHALVHPRDDSEAARVARERYAAHYSTARLRELAGRIKGSRHGDLWRQFQILVRALSGDPSATATRTQLALPALGSFLWDPASTTALNDAELTNFDLLEALRHLGFTRQGKVLRPVDYKNLGAEELGGVYESLLALTPQVSADGARFGFAEFAGNERKTSGSYYTPDSLVQCLLDSALDSVVDEAIKGKTSAEAEQAILGLKVCDPAVGSGHFLVGAAHRLAWHLARVRAQAQGESEPSPLLYQHALRDVIGRCLYGVDVNPMAAELCRVSLWLEALEPGKPLSFLDHHIRVGNSLLGTTPELIAAGLPEEALNPIEGDDKKACAELKKRNRAESKGRGSLFVAEDAERAEALRSAAKAVDEMDDDTPERLARKAQTFAEAQTRYDYIAAKRLADAWCAAFVIRKHFPPLAHNPKFADTKPFGITQGHISDLAQGRDLPTELAGEVDRLARQYQFFHWHLVFPEVFARGGFDCVLGNPPWERLKLAEDEWFAPVRPDISAAANATARQDLIARLAEEAPHLLAEYRAAKRQADNTSAFARNSGAYPLCGVGDINTYALFAELNWRIANPVGRVGCVLQAGIATDKTTSPFFERIVSERALVSLFSFDNRDGIFPDIKRSTRFCLMTLTGTKKPFTDGITFTFYARSLEEIADPARRVVLKASDIALLNPNTKTCPVFQSAQDCLLVSCIYRRIPIAIDEGTDTNTWDLTIRRVLDMNKQDVLRLCVQTPAFHAGSLVGVYEAKLFDQMNHRGSTYDRGRVRAVTQSELEDPSFALSYRYWIQERELANRLPQGWMKQWFVVWQDVTDVNTMARSVSAVVLPLSGTDFTVRVGFPLRAPADGAILFVSSLNSFVFDYVSRQKIGGTHLADFVLKQLPVLTPESVSSAARFRGGSETLREWLLPRVLELTYTAWDLQAFAREYSWDGPPFRWDEDRRFLIRCELDAAFFHLYLPADADGQWRPARKADGSPHDETPEEFAELKRCFRTPRDAVAYIMDTFPIVRRKDEEKYDGDYRTKRVVLEICDAMQEAIRTGQPYQSRLDPPPGPPRDAEGNFVRYAQIAGNPPPHIHLPRDAATDGSVARQLSDLATRFPATPFVLRLGASGSARTVRVRPVKTADIQVTDRIVLSSPNLQSSGSAGPAAVGRLRVESRTNAGDGSSYVLVTVRGDDGNAQARFSEEEWRGLTTVGVVEESSEA